MIPEFVIRMDPPGPNGHPVELFERDGAVLTSLAQGVMDLPEAEGVRLELLLPDKTPDSAVFKEGAALYARLQAALGKRLDTVLDGDPAQIYLDLPKGGLHKVPWEIMVWSADTIDGRTPTAVARKHHLSRVFQPNWTSAVPPPHGPLRVLIVIGARADAAVEAEAEEEEIRRLVQPAQRTIDIDTVAPASKAVLYKRITEFRPHVLHFIGHGQSQPALLKFMTWAWTASEIVGDVGNFNLDYWKPSLVFLNACRTGNAAGSSGSLGAAFLTNSSAVIAMQGDIKGTAAGALAGEFYERLAGGTPVNEALSRGRGAIAGANDTKQAAFAALTTRCAPACTLPSFHCLDATYRARVPVCDFFPTLQVFVNQVEPRRKLCRSFWPLQQGDLPQRFVMLRGNPKFGKSLLSAWLLDLGLRLGHHVRYVKLSGESAGVSCIKVLDLIWNAETLGMSSPLTDPLPALPEKLAAELRESLDPEVYGPFRDELRKVSSQQAVTIVLDQLQQKMDPGGFWTLWKNLFIPLARNELPNVNLVLAMSQEDYAEYEIDTQLKTRPELRIPINEIVLEGLSSAEFGERFREYAYFRSERFRDATRKGLLDYAVQSMLLEMSPPHPISSLEKQLGHLASAVGVKLDQLH